MNRFGPLRHPAFRLLSAARTVNALGNSFASIALGFAILDLTGSATDLGLVVGIRTLVNVLFLLFGGVLADRLPRHLLMVGSSAVAALTQGTIAALVLTHTATIPWLIALSIVNGMVAALSFPATAALVPQTVPAEERQQANAVGRMLLNGATIVGAPLAGIVVAAVGPGWGIAVDAGSFAVAALCFALVRIPAPASVRPAAGPADPAAEFTGAEQSGGLPAAEAKPSIFADLRTGWAEFWGRTWLWVVVAGFCVINACNAGSISVLGPVIADATFGRKSWGFVLAATTAGLIVGGLIAMRIRIRRLLFLGCVTTGAMVAPVLVLGLSPHVGLLVVAGIISGLGLEQFGVAWETTMQEHIPADKLARVYSYDMVGSLLAVPIGQVLAGPAAHAFGTRAALVGAATLIVLAVLGMVSSRDVRHLRHELPQREVEPMEELAT